MTIEEDNYLQSKLDALEAKMTTKNLGSNDIMRQTIDCIVYLKRIKELAVEIKAKTTINVVPYIKAYLDL